MSDKVTLQVAGRRIEKFISYRVEADLYCADNYFRIEMQPPGFDIDPAMPCKLYVNDTLAMTGIIDRLIDGDDKRGNYLSVEGRDLMGLLVDSYATAFIDHENVALKDLAEQLLADVPFINRKAVKYQKGLAGALATSAQDTADGLMADLGIGQKNTHIDPGQTIFEVLKKAAMSRGATFFGLPDGTFVFGRPKAAGKPAFNIVQNAAGLGNNVLRGQRMRDNSRRYSKIIVVGQQQGDDLLGADEVNVKAELDDDQAPFYKPYVVVLNDDDLSPDKYARMLLEIQRAESFQLVYTVPGHSQAGRNWTVNELCRVKDTVRQVDGTFLTISRAFELSKREGCFTELRLSYPGVVR